MGGQRRRCSSLSIQSCWRARRCRSARRLRAAVHNWNDAAGAAKRTLARREVGGTPATAADAYAARSPIAHAREIAASGVPLQIWWSRTDRVVVESPLQSGLLVKRIRTLNPAAPLTEVVGAWRHTAVLHADSSLPTMLAGLGLLSPPGR
jgi:hypothetical protein